MKLSPFSRSALQGIIFGFSAIITVIITAIVYATSSWGSLPTVNTGSGLSANTWNDLVAHVNQSVKQASQVITVSGAYVGIGTTNPSAKFDITGASLALGMANTDKWGLWTDTTNDNFGIAYIGGNYPTFYGPTWLTITKTGSVGVGVIPSEKLEISSGGALRLNSNSAQPLNIFVARGDGGGNSGNVYCSLPTTGGGRANAVCLAAWDQSGVSIGCSTTVSSSHLARFLCVAP